VERDSDIVLDATTTSVAATVVTLDAAGAVSPLVQVGSEGSLSNPGNHIRTSTPTPHEVEENSKSLANPPPPPAMPKTGETIASNGMVEPGLLLPTTIRELRQMEALVKAKKKIIRSMQKKAADPNDKIAVAKQLAAQLKAMKTEVKMEKERAKMTAKEQAKTNIAVRSLPKRPRSANVDDDEDDGNSDVIEDFAPPGKRVLNTIDKWQKGHRRAALLAAQNKVVETVTVGTWAEAHANMCKYGWAVVDNFVDLLHPACRPDADMRDYILDCTFHSDACLCVVLLLRSCHNILPNTPIVPEDCKETIFEGATFSDCSAFVDAHYDRVNDNARKQMKQTQPGAQAAKWKAFNARYGLQTSQIIEGYTVYEGYETVMDGNSAPHATRQRGSAKRKNQDNEGSAQPKVIKHVPGMFAGAAGIAANWKMGMTSLVNGLGYQHPHSDAGRPESYKNMSIFPFVTIHGFGIDPFSMWLLPEPFSNASKYGFLHTFQPHQMLLMRGDFVHAGVPSTVPRGHMKFFPSQQAGWNQETSFWHRKGSDNVTFLWQGPFPPFGYPCIGTPDINGKQVVTYPVAYTNMLRFTYTFEQCEMLGIPYEEINDVEKARRSALKKKAVASLDLCVYNI
jgi:hypothetical protein